MRLYAALPDKNAFAIVRGKQSMSVDTWRSADSEDR